jgi:hypothetical protein
LAGVLLKESSQIGSTPTATRARAEAITKLCNPPRPLDPQIIDEFPLRHVKAEANFVVEFHAGPRMKSQSRSRSDQHNARFNRC